jgi:ferric citrate transport system permease protein
VSGTTDIGMGAATAAPNRRLRALATLAVIVVVFCVGFLWSISIGTEPISLRDMIVGIFDPADGNVHQLVVHLIRLPRVVLAALVGATLAVAGVVMQSITNNPLGAPEILGVNAGAAVTVALATTIVPSIADAGTLFLAFGGGAVAAALVFGIARYGRGGLSPVRLALAGVTISLLLFSLMQGILIVFSQNAELFFFWLIGGVNNANWHEVDIALPWMVAGLVLALLLAARLNVLALGDDVARGLGQNVTWTRFLGAACVVLLAGAAVGVAGPVAFLGLITPHIVRKLTSHNHFVVVPVSIVVGATLFVYADIGSRYLAEGIETPSGVVTAMIGAPFFIYLARREKMAS